MFESAYSACTNSYFIKSIKIFLTDQFFMFMNSMLLMIKDEKSNDEKKQKKSNVTMDVQIYHESRRNVKSVSYIEHIAAFFLAY